MRGYDPEHGTNAIWRSAEDIECERRLRELMGKAWDSPDLPWEAILTTTSARTHVDCMGSSDADGYMASDLLKALVAECIDVYIVTTRTVLYPDGCDKCMFDLVPEENFFTPDPEMMGRSGVHAHCPAAIDAWTRCCVRMGIEIPPHVPQFHIRKGHRAWTHAPPSTDAYEVGRRTWMDVARLAGEATDVLVRR